MAIEQNISPYSQFFTGEDKTLAFTIYQSDGATAQDITGWALSYMVKEDRDDDDGDALLTKTTADDITITNGAAGLCAVALEDDDIAELDGDTKYYHELKRIDAGFETVLTHGTFQLNAAVHE